MKRTLTLIFIFFSFGGHCFSWGTRFRVVSEHREESLQFEIDALELNARNGNQILQDERKFQRAPSSFGEKRKNFQIIPGDRFESWWRRNKAKLRSIKHNLSTPDYSYARWALIRVAILEGGATYYSYFYGDLSVVGAVSGFIFIASFTWMISAHYDSLERFFEYGLSDFLNEKDKQKESWIGDRLRGYFKGVEHFSALYNSISPHLGFAERKLAITALRNLVKILITRPTSLFNGSALVPFFADLGGNLFNIPARRIQSLGLSLNLMNRKILKVGREGFNWIREPLSTLINYNIVQLSLGSFATVDSYTVLYSLVGLNAAFFIGYYYLRKKKSFNVANFFNSRSGSRLIEEDDPFVNYAIAELEPLTLSFKKIEVGDLLDYANEAKSLLSFNEPKTIKMIEIERKYINKKSRKVGLLTGAIKRNRNQMRPRCVRQLTKSF